MTHLPLATSGGTLRERFIADMTVRGFTDKTRKDYLRTVTSPLDKIMARVAPSESSGASSGG